MKTRFFLLVLCLIGLSACSNTPEEKETEKEKPVIVLESVRAGGAREWFDPDDTTDLIWLNGNVCRKNKEGAWLLVSKDERATNAICTPKTERLEWSSTTKTFRRDLSEEIDHWSMTITVKEGFSITVEVKSDPKDLTVESLKISSILTVVRVGETLYVCKNGKILDKSESYAMGDIDGDGLEDVVLGHVGRFEKNLRVIFSDGETSEILSDEYDEDSHESSGRNISLSPTGLVFTVDNYGGGTVIVLLTAKQLATIKNENRLGNRLVLTVRRGE